MVRLAAVPVLLAGLPLGYATLIQKPLLFLPSSAKGHREAAKKIFTDSYAAYKASAFGHDDLAPVSASFVDSRNGWGASIVDALSTMKIMGLDDLFEEGVEFASKIDFSKSHTDDTVSVFETTIRFVGGLLSAYELDGNKHPVLVQKAKEVADKLVYAWTDDHDIPYGHLNFTDNQPVRDTSNIAEAGTLALEWLTLSKYTKNSTYADLTLRAFKHIANLTPPLPGLAAQGIDPTSGNFVGDLVTWSGGSDSYFEYLIKYARLTNTDDTLFVKTWHTAVDSTIKNLLKKSSVGDHVYVGEWTGGKLVPTSSHLECFHGGNWLMGGKLMANQTIVKHALDLIDACWNTYASTATGIGPEVFKWFPEGTNATIDGDDLAFYNEHGFYIDAADYILRPEVLESNFYAWRVTGNTKYLDRAADAIESFNKVLTSPNFKGYAPIEDVNSPNGGNFIDDMESFWFAEVLKYLYLTFDDPLHINLDQWVFNTEAHPFKAPLPKLIYTDGSLFPHTHWPNPFKTVDGPLPKVSPIPGLSDPFARST